MTRLYVFRLRAECLPVQLLAPTSPELNLSRCNHKQLRATISVHSVHRMCLRKVFACYFIYYIIIWY